MNDTYHLNSSHSLESPGDVGDSARGGASSLIASGVKYETLSPL